MASTPTLEEPPRLPARGGSTRIRRFNGMTRRTTDWDGLRRDSQLWFDDGDCLIHFYGFGASQRGPSLRIPFTAVEKLESTHVMTECLHKRTKDDKLSVRPAYLRTNSNNSVALANMLDSGRPLYELYIPAPRDVGRDESFSYHLSTRNFFAYAVGMPVVGERLSAALGGLWQRLQTWAPKAATISGITAYLEQQGYSNFAENAEHALACLKFSEQTKIHNLWTNAFVHCVGMHERLYLSPEYPGLSDSTTALITRAALEKDLHIARVVRAVGLFLEEEFGTEHLGLSKPARDHLDFFRSFLHSFYVNKVGYFPPKEITPWDKRPWMAMYEDFQHLYNYLVDTDSTVDRTSAKALTGGICVIQNVQAFDQRHGYEPLPHPLPLLPQQQEPQRRKTASQKALRTLALGHAGKIPERKHNTSQSLAMATNCLDDDVMACQLVQEYQRFEREKLNVKLDASEARKTRWLLIYGVLQMLTSIMKAPQDVRDAEETSYALCILPGSSPPWIDNNKFRSEDFKAQNIAAPSLVPDAMASLEGRTSRISIHPDCEADNAEDFFALNSVPRFDAPHQSNFVPSLRRTGSIRSSMHSGVQALSRSVGSLSKRGSFRRESPRNEFKQTPSYCEIVIEDYGNGTENQDIEWRPATAFHDDDLYPNPLQDFDFDLDGATGEPTLESDQLDYDYPYPDSFNRRDSYPSTLTDSLTTSPRSSFQADDDSPDTDLSSWDSGSYSADESESSGPTTPTEPTRRRLNVGCYVPSGMVPTAPPPVVKYSRHQRTQSEKSTASSLYPDESVQAADIEIIERGRRRSRTFEQDVSVYAV